MLSTTITSMATLIIGSPSDSIIRPPIGSTHFTMIGTGVITIGRVRTGTPIGIGIHGGTTAATVLGGITLTGITTTGVTTATIIPTTTALTTVIIGIAQGRETLVQLAALVQRGAYLPVEQVLP